MDGLIKYTVLGVCGLALFAAALPIFGPILWIIFSNPLILGLVVFSGLIFWLYKMKEDKNKNV